MTNKEDDVLTMTDGVSFVKKMEPCDCEACTAERASGKPVRRQDPLDWEPIAWGDVCDDWRGEKRKKRASDPRDREPSNGTFVRNKKGEVY